MSDVNNHPPEVSVNHIDSNWLLDVDGKRYPAILRSPEVLAERPALLIHLTLISKLGFEQEPFCIVPKTLLAAGHRVASFDLPNHGPLVDEYGEGLTGMAAAIADGQDVFGRATAIGKALIDKYQATYPGSGPILVSGSSRGGLIALQLLAADNRVTGGAAFATVTNLLALHEFHELEDADLVRESSAAAIVPSLQNRPTFLTINSTDDRVSTADCIAFHEALLTPDFGDDTHRLRIDPAEGHTCSDDAYAEGAAWLLTHIERWNR